MTSRESFREARTPEHTASLCVPSAIASLSIPPSSTPCSPRRFAFGVAFGVTVLLDARLVTLLDVPLSEPSSPLASPLAVPLAVPAGPSTMSSAV